MTLKVHHRTSYHYEDAVFLDPHYFYLKPQVRAYLDLKDFQIEVSPTPKGITERIDIENNEYFQVWNHNKTNHLEVIVNSTISLKELNLFNFLIDPPMQLNKGNIYNSSDIVFLKPYLTQSIPAHIKKFTTNLAEQTNYDPISFLNALLAEISQNWDHTIRMEQNILPVDQCFSSKEGSCRDLTAMLMDMLRAIGLATRFVSGYAYNPELAEGHELHAWAEVLLPGAGWIGIDPSLGLFTNEMYIPLATSYTPANTMTVKGHYRGQVKAILDTEVTITEQN
ncbi:transglutaminase family protein [Fulvivirga sediminis]|uniref:Transglutaminase family protein n=1 Tax=Fulvivirga sediminis TaxID=2803949 RepID=A0A937FBE6_9BACT|nr:transglutaminase family protein [Fulvivirga sediminis]MBL3658537.1 transglutaminase family protein [Fulvivirga sediminis]